VTRYLSPEQVLFIHSRLIAETGGSHGVRDLSMLLSALGRPTASFDGNELYADVHSKAAALMDSLIRNHPFVDGNKRTAMTCAGLFLRMNGYNLVVEPSEMVTFTIACAQSIHSLAEITGWLRKYSFPVY
jgi:death-on-curing protein